MTPDEYMQSKHATCVLCGEPKADVRVRSDPFAVELARHYRWPPPYVIRCCNACVRQRQDDV